MWVWVLLHEVKAFAFLQTDDGFFPMGGPTEVGAALPLLFAPAIQSADVGDFLAEGTLNGLLDLQLVGPPIDTENILVVRFRENGCLLGEPELLNDLENVLHNEVR